MGTAKTASILLVEDEKESLDLLVSTLTIKYPGIALYSAYCGRSGLEAFAAHRPDIVITDLNMPDMNGAEMIVAIRALKPETRFIVLTADSGKTFTNCSDDCVCIDQCLLKPVTIQALFAAVDQCLGTTDC